MLRFLSFLSVLLAVVLGCNSSTTPSNGNNNNNSTVDTTSANVVGNSKTMVYHVKGCRYISEIAAENYKALGSCSHAVALGYTRDASVSGCKNSSCP